MTTPTTVKDQLKTRLAQFMQEDKEFLYESDPITDSNGFKASIYADFLEEENNEDNKTRIYVKAYVDQQPSQEKQKIKNSTAFQTAISIIEKAINNTVPDATDMDKDSYHVMDTRDIFKMDAKHRITASRIIKYKRKD